MTMSEACKTFGVSRQVVSYWCRNGKLPGSKKVDGTWLIPDGAKRPENLQGYRGEQKHENLRFEGDSVDYIRRAAAYHSIAVIRQKTGLTRDEIRMIYDRLFREGKVA